MQRLMEVGWIDLADRTGYAPEKFTTEVYQASVASKRHAAALAAPFQTLIPELFPATLRLPPQLAQQAALTRPIPSAYRKITAPKHAGSTADAS